MHSPKKSPAHAGARYKLLMRGESAIASAGLALAATMMMAIAGAGAWTVFSLRHAARAHLRADVESWARFLAGSAESKLSDPTGKMDVRADLARIAEEHELARCRIVLANGATLADGLRAANKAESTRSEPGDERGWITATAPLTAGKDGPGELQIAARPRYSAWTGWETQAGIGVIGVLGFGAFLAVYRHLRARLRAVGAIREALLAATQGETSAAALSVSDQFGPEAGAWNSILAEREQLRKELLSKRTSESLGARADTRTDLAYACDALWQGLVLLDDKLTVKYANGAAAVLLRAKREAMTGVQVSELIQDPQLLDAIKAVASGQVRRRTSLEIKRAPTASSDAAGQAAITPLGVFRYSIRPVRREDAAAALIFIEDITQQRIADDARNAFVAQATHELRTPLTNIRLYVEQAIEIAPKRDDPDLDPHLLPKALDVINQESRRLERIVADMLSVSEIEAGSFKLRPGDVRLENLFEDLKSEYDPQAAEKNIKLTLRLPPKLPVINGDRDKIVLALHNLLGNAIKYTPTGGRVEVKVEVETGGGEGGDTVKVSIADTGIGISPDETDLIFEKFYRAKDKRVAEITGTGLGLALAREVVRLHGGDITVQSELDKGSTFTMTIPSLAQAA